MTFPRPEDLALIPVQFGESARSAHLELTEDLCRPDGPLYGGTGIAASVIAMEAASAREVVWVTTQFVSSPRAGDTLHCSTDVLASGRRTTQLSVTARSGPQVAFTALGSTGVHRDDSLAGQFETMPDVVPPQDAPARGGGFGGMRTGWGSRVEMREATVLRTETRGPHHALWSRLLDGVPPTPAGIAFMADMVPVAVARAAGRAGAGTSLDNSMRFGPQAETEWVLLELRGHLATGGYGHGTVYVWSQSGTLVAVGSQTASMMLFDDSRRAPWATPT